jgi:hypothetical protein
LSIAAKAERGAPDGAAPDPGGLRGVLVIAGEGMGPVGTVQPCND